MKILTLLFILFLAGCTSTGISESKVPSPGKGVVFASVLFSGSYSENSIFIRKVGEADVVRMGLGEAMILLPIFPTGDFADIGYNSMGKKGAVLAEELAPGDYEVFDWSVRAGYRTVSAKQSFSIPFTVVRGQASYLGSYTLTHLGRRNNSVSASVESLLERDARIFDSKFKEYKAMQKTAYGPAEALHNLGNGSSVSDRIPMPLILPVPR
jgi:hypothetical protein